ncbi:MAG: ATP-NAD kinase family protein [Thermoplasmata archaeon]|nr:ATP-NAD kinase family protein [Thermoplasmata archaeon]
MVKIGFVLNPVAGMGGSVGLKGTDDVVEEALRRGASPVAAPRAKRFFQVLGAEYGEILRLHQPSWFSAGDPMGSAVCAEAGINPEIVYRPAEPTTREDTLNAVREFVGRKCDLILFCGGDGTARDIVSVVGTRTPVLGIPAGVKMHSGVFATTPETCARVVADFIAGELRMKEGEIMDVDEEAYRRGIWQVKLFGIALTPSEPEFVQTSKCVIEVDENDILDGIAEHVIEEIEKEKDVLFVFGPGSTTAHVFEKLGLEKTMLGVDCVASKALVARDVSERELLDLIPKYRKVKLVLSPIGGQGFVLGRGNQQISAAVLRHIDIDDMMIIATPAKLASIPALRFDIYGGEGIDRFKERNYLPVITGYHTCTMKRVHL